MRLSLTKAVLAASVALTLAPMADAQFRRPNDPGGYLIPGTGIRMFPGPRRIIRFGGATVYDGGGWGNNYPQSFFTRPRGAIGFNGGFSQLNGFNQFNGGFRRFR